MAATESVRAKAWSYHQQGLLLPAEQLYRQLLHSEPDKADAVNLGALLREQGRLLEALQHYQAWLPRFSRAPDLSLNAINCAIAAGKLDQAQLWVDAALGVDPERRELLQAKARLLQAQHCWPEAEALLDALSQKHPNDANVQLDLGLVHHRQGHHQQALDSFQQAARLAPNDPRPAANQLTVLGDQGRWGDAQRLVKTLPSVLRQSLQVKAAIAHLLMGQQLMVEAAAEFAQLCQVEPGEPLHWLNRTACLRNLKHNMAAMAVAKRGAILHPNHENLQHALAQCLADAGKPDQAMALLNRRLANNKDLSDQQLFNLQFLGTGYRLMDASRLEALAQRWESQQRSLGVGALWADRIRRPLDGRALRVGYLSADFCNHPVGRFLLPVLEHHNQAAVEVVGLNCGPHHDALLKRLRQCCREWHDLRFHSDLEAARIISDLQLDLLVELGGFTSGSRIGILCHRPAPVQLSYLGYFGPTYLHCVDGWIGDTALFAGLSDEECRAHQLCELQGGYMVYVQDDLPTPERTVSGTSFRFGSFNHARKLSRDAVELFTAVMTAVPQAELVLKSISFVEPDEQVRVKHLFLEAGLSKDRLILLPWVEGHANHLRCYSQIDVALDPLPYGGATTTCEALAMGVPVVSLAGPGMVGRLSASVLIHANCQDWLGHCPEEYVSIAAALAAAGPRGQTARLALRKRVLESDLSNGRRLAGGLERLYRRVATTQENALSN